MLTNFKASFDDIIKMFIPNASGYKTRCENRRGKGSAKKICSSIRDFCRGLWYRKSLLLVMVQLSRKRLVEESYILKWHYTVERARRCNQSK